MPPRSDHVHDRLDDYLHDLLEPDDMDHVERHCAACPDCKAALQAARTRLTALQTVPASEASEELIQTTLHRIEQHDVRRSKVRRWWGWSFGGTLAASIAIIASFHIYYANLRPTSFDIRLLGQTQFLPGASTALRVRLYGVSQAQPLEGVPVTVELRDRRSGRVEQLASFTTNAQGTGEPRLRMPDWDDGSYELRVIAKPSGTTEELSQMVTLKRSWKLMLSSDKPVYQPGQDILIRSLALRKPDLKPIADHEVVFSITDPKGNVIFKEQKRTSKFGISSTRCPLAAEVLEGPYTLACKVGDTESKRTVEVKKYVLPKFRVAVELDQPFYQPGDIVKGTVQADYFFGQPVAEGQVQVELDNEAGGNTEQVARTDVTGKASFRLLLPRFLVGRSQDSGNARCNLTVIVTDRAGQKQSRTVSCVVTTKPLRIEVFAEGGSLIRGVDNRIYLFASYADGRPAKARLAVSGLEQELETNELGVASFPLRTGSDFVSLTVKATDAQGRTVQQHFQLNSGQANLDFLIRTDRAVYNAGDTVRLTALGGGPEPVFVDFLKDGQTILTETVPMTNGRGEYRFDLPAELFGTVELCAYRFGAEGLPVRKTRALYIRQAGDVQVQAILDQKEYRPGRKASLRLTLTDKSGRPAPGAISLVAVDEAVFSVLDQAPGMEKIFYLLEQEILQPIYAIYPWSPDASPRLPPQQREEFEQALFVRTTAIDNSGGAQPSWQRQSMRSSPRFAEPMPATDMAPVATTRSRTVTPHSLSVSSFALDSQRVRDLRETGLERVWTAWALVILTLGVAGYAALWVFVRPIWVVLVLHAVVLPILCVVPVLMLGKNASGTFSMVSDRVAALSPRAEMEMADRDPLGRDSVPVMPEAEPGGADGKPGQAVRVRQDFRETLLWQPELITDDDGRAPPLDIPLADSITTWRLTASAVTTSGQLGATQESIRVFQPFFVDLNLPVALTRGDVVTVPVVVYNYLDKPQTVELELDEARWFERLDQGGKRIELGPREVRSVSYPIRVLKVGPHQLQVTARGSDLADAIRRDIEVVPDGRKVEQVVTDRLTGNVSRTVTIPDDCVPDSQKILVKLYPGVFSQVIEGMEGMLRMPFG